MLTAPFRYESFWQMDDDEMFFKYEDYYGCDGTIPDLNARARRNGCKSEYENPDEYYDIKQYADKQAEQINAQLKSFAKKKRKKKEIDRLTKIHRMINHHRAGNNC